jgi:biopolymer transport protein ExbD
VLLISSAFVQIMIIETDLPQAVKEAIQQNEEKPKTTVQLEISAKSGIKVIVARGGKQNTELIALKSAGVFDLVSLHKQLQKVKTENPEVFKIELAPDSNVPYKEIVKIMDEARRSHDKNVTFPIFDKKTNKQATTDFMFPDVVFANMMDG